MPLTFPSHQGLILPLARRWPRRFDALALCAGAAMPDVVDAIFGLFRGHLGQTYGHTLAGMFLFSWPGGLLLTWLLVMTAAYLSKRIDRARRIQSALAGLAYSPAQNAGTPGARVSRSRLVFLSLSIWVGALSHLLFDFVSHGNCLWLYPLLGNSRIFPEWWYASWFEIPVPFYEETYPFGPHLVVWIGLTVVGALLFFGPVLRRRRGARRCSGNDENPGTSSHRQ